MNHKGSFNKLAAGRKVYSNGSHAPTRGKVKPLGYIKRELKKQRRKKAAGKLVRGLR